ncbi:50S ribosomal protein L19 [Promineifilum sp.]|uniref:50S ribosomal protein L19 n=1 Tax=Promineifilum sp. TaxID=2664178 RepID=UPI0035B1609F
MSDLLLKAFDNEKNAALPQVTIGDSVTVFVRINVGDKNERVQMVRGTIIRVRNAGNNANFTVRRIASNGIGVERTFLMSSPRIEKIEVHSHGHVRRARLYYLRERTGKATRLRAKRTFEQN